VCGSVNSYSTHWKKDQWEVGKCTLCGRNAKYNTPKLRGDNGQLVCDSCGDEGKPEDVVLIGVEQFLKDGQYELTKSWETYELNGNLVWIYTDSDKVNAWTRGGQQAFHFNDSEYGMSVIEMFHLMETKVDDNHYRCTGCNGDFEGKPSGYPLFAGVTCSECWLKHKEHMEEQRKAGHVCSMCRKPYGECCC
jgi:hypothetical protein